MATKHEPMTWSAFIPFEKVDLENRIVSGWATVEEPDRQKKIVDYASAKAAIATWAGNMREMHGLTAVGKAVDVQPDDIGKRIWLETYVSKSADGENTLTKISEGILTGFSIAGQLSARVPEIVKDAAGAVIADAREYVKSITEISYVDLPAAPSAVYALTKSADFLADLPAEEPVPEPILAVADAPSLGSDVYLGPDGKPITAPASPDQVAAAKAAMPNLSKETNVADQPAAVAETPAADPAPAEVVDDAAKAATPEVTKAALDDMTDAHIAAEKIGLMIESATDGADVAPLKTALAAVEAWGTAQAEAIGTPEDDAEVEAEAPVPVVIVADYSYYAAVMGDLAKLAIARKSDPEAAVPVHVQQLLELAKAAGASLPEDPGTITKAAVAAAVDAAVGSDETIAKYASGLVDRMGPLFEAVKVGLLEELRSALTPVSEQVEKIANRPVREGPFRYAPGRDGELLRGDEQALAGPVSDALTKAMATPGLDPAVREDLGRLAATLDIKKAQSGR